MNSEYLTNKEGNDFEVEQLEAMLTEFRITPVPPSMSRLAQQERGPIVSRYKLQFALGLSSLVVTVAAVVSLVNLRLADAPRLADVNVPTAGAVLPTLSIEVAEATKKPVEDPQVNLQKNRLAGRPMARRVNFQAKNKKSVGSSDQITAAERHAYEQVKVALFIAGSKLKIVQDTIDRVNENELSHGKLKR